MRASTTFDHPLALSLCRIFFRSHAVPARKWHRPSPDTLKFPVRWWQNSPGTLILLIFKRGWISGVMIAFAVLNSYSRVYLGKHYVSDVVAGALLGLVLGYLVYLALMMFNKTLNSESE